MTTTILIADDEPGIRDALESCLVFEGYEVRTAPDGRAALAEIERSRPDLVLLDVRMPGMDGLTACRRLRAHDPHLPVLMLTARDMTGDRVAGLDAGADDYLAKPFELDELLARVRALLRRGALMADEPIGVQIGIVPDTLPHASFQLFRQPDRQVLALSPFRLGEQPNIRVGVAMITSAPEALALHEKMAKELWQRSLKNAAAVRLMRALIEKQ